MNTSGTLYRSNSNKRIAGVCAGVAEYFGVETWLVRILTITAFFLLAGPFIFVAYIALWFIMDVRPKDLPVDTTNVVGLSGTAKGWYSKDSKRIEIKQKVWQAGEPPKQAFHDIKGMFDQCERRLRDVETYVTSKAYQLDRELNKL